MKFDIIERFIRLSLGVGAAINELFLRAQAQPYVLLFIASCMGLPEALRVLRPPTGKEGP